MPPTSPTVTVISTWDPTTTRLATLCRAHGTVVFESIREAVDAGTMSLPDSLAAADAMTGPDALSPDDVLRELGVDPARILHALDGPERHATDVVERLWPGMRPRDHDVAWMAVRRWALHRGSCFVEDVRAAIRGGYGILQELVLSHYVLPTWVAAWSGLRSILREEETTPAHVDALLGLMEGSTEQWMRHTARLAIRHLAVDCEAPPLALERTLMDMAGRLARHDDALCTVLVLAATRMLARAGCDQEALEELCARADEDDGSELAFDALLGVVRRDIETDVRTLALAREAFREREEDRSRSDHARARWALLARACDDRLARLSYAPLASGEADDGVAGALAAILRRRRPPGESGATEITVEETQRAMYAWNRRTIGLDDEDVRPTPPDVEARHVSERWVALLDVVPTSEGDIAVVIEDVHLDEALAPRPEDAWSRT